MESQIGEANSQIIIFGLCEILHMAISFSNKLYVRKVAIEY